MFAPQEILAGMAGGRVLDVATGSGGFIGFLLDGLGGYEEIVGVDTNERAAAAFSEAFKDKPQIHFVKMDAVRLDFPDGSFDTVCISNSLHHMTDPEAVLVEMLRVLRPGGHLLVSEMYRDDQTETQMTHVLLHHWWAAVDRLSGIVHNETFTRRQIVSILEDLDLTDLVWYDQLDLSGDPKDPATLSELETAIERYLQRLEGYPELVERGDSLLARLRETGFHSATTLFVCAEKL